MDYDMDLAIKIQQDWFDTIFPNGWIPREQMRGKEAEYFAPNFIVQIENEGNPPAFILALDYLVTNIYKNRQKIMQHFQDNIEKLEQWFNWYRKQEFKSGVFVWWRNQDRGYLGTGLDDYPREDDKGNREQYSLDLQVWMTHFAQTLSNVYALLGNNEKYYHYDQLMQLYQIQLNTIYFDPIHQIYKSLFAKNNNDSDVTFEPFLGYVNLFPLFFGYIPIHKIEGTLKLMRNEKFLWSNYGLLSLSRKDFYYMKNDQYWTGPIWININYLALRGLFKFYIKNNPLAFQVYRELRENIMNTVCDSYWQTGHFWEQYNQNTGKGQRNHPFNGWTSLIALIIDENYH